MKWTWLQQSKALSERLKKLQSTQIEQVPRLQSADLCPPTQGAFSLYRLTWEHAPGTPLINCNPQTANAALKLFDWRALFQNWREKNFIHGDLSPRNILVTAEQTLHFIDPILDFAHSKGTPRYQQCHPSGNEYCASRILEERGLAVRFIS